MIEIYFVLSDGDKPKKVCFDYEHAIKLDYLYIDSFDSYGDPLKAYKQVDREEYTEDF